MQRNVITIARLIFSGVAALQTHLTIQAQTLGAHAGAADPGKIEGFSIYTTGKVSMGPVLDPGGIRAWEVNVPGPLFGNANYYQEYPLETALASQTLGWNMQATLKIVSGTNTSARVFYMENGYVWEFSVSQNDYGTPSIKTYPYVNNIYYSAGFEYSLSNLDSGYHTYEMRYDAATQLHSVWADGSLIAPDVGPSSSPGDPIGVFGWSTSGGNSIGTIHWSAASLVIVPEPTETGVVGGLFCLAGVACWRKGRRLRIGVKTS